MRKVITKTETVENKYYIFTCDVCGKSFETIEDIYYDFGDGSAGTCEKCGKEVCDECFQKICIGQEWHKLCKNCLCEIENLIKGENNEK